MLANSGRFEEFLALKNSSGNGIDIIAKTYSGRWVFYEIKTSTGAVAPALKGLQRQGARQFVTTRLSQIAGKKHVFKNVSNATAANAQRILNEIRASGEVQGHVMEIANLGKATQQVNIRGWSKIE